MDLGGIFANFTINLIAGVVGILIVLVIERQRRPCIRMQVGEPGKLLPDDPLGRPEITWLRVQVHNIEMPRWLSWVYDRDPALNCRAWITFYRFDGHRVFDEEMEARWTETPEPIVEIKETEKGPVGRLVNVQHTVDIPPGEYVNVDIACRLKGKDQCYGWNNESYLYNWCHPRWKLGKERYIAKVRVKTGGREFIDAFLIVNDVPYEDFRIEALHDELRARVLTS